ncbi:MAG: hypothetical protein KF866_09130 [Phycisphaeraceae bacterium]|nr:hypothetical protein [Phycisphaeraceae bacterium]
MRKFLDTCGGLFQLTRLAFLSKGRFRGPYWQWRIQTAYGRGLPASRRRRLHDLLEYARWVHRVRRMR